MTLNFDENSSDLITTSCSHFEFVKDPISEGFSIATIRKYFCKTRKFVGHFSITFEAPCCYGHWLHAWL